MDVQDEDGEDVDVLRSPAIDFEQVNDNAQLKTYGFVGFAHIYLQQCTKKSEADNEIDIQVYTTLVQVDSNSGTTAAEQLSMLVTYSLRLDLVKVSI